MVKNEQLQQRLDYLKTSRDIHLAEINRSERSVGELMKVFRQLAESVNNVAS